MYVVNESKTMKAKMYNGKKASFSANIAGKTKQLHVKELYRTTFSHHIQKQA